MTEPSPSTLGELLRTRRVQLGLSIRAVGRLARVSPPSVLALEKKSSGSLATATRIARSLNQRLVIPPYTRLRKALRLSRHELAARAGLSVLAVTNAARRPSICHLRTHHLLAETLGARLVLETRP